MIEKDKVPSALTGKATKLLQVGAFRNILRGEDQTIPHTDCLESDDIAHGIEKIAYESRRLHAIIEQVLSKINAGLLRYLNEGQRLLSSFRYCYMISRNELTITLTHSLSTVDSARNTFLWRILTYFPHSWMSVI